MIQTKMMQNKKDIYLELAEKKEMSNTIIINYAEIIYVTM